MGNKKVAFVERLNVTLGARSLMLVVGTACSGGAERVQLFFFLLLLAVAGGKVKASSLVRRSIAVEVLLNA